MESRKFLSSYASHFMGGPWWEVQSSICRVCVSISKTGEKNSLEEAEDLLIKYIVAMVPKYVESKQRWKKTEFYPATLSALALGEIYARRQLDGEAATLLSWFLDSSTGISRRYHVKRLLRCLRALGLLSDEVFRQLNEKVNKPSDAEFGINGLRSGG